LELLTPLADAVIWVVPTLTAVAKPVPLIVATVVLLLVQVNVTPAMMLPALSSAVALNCWVAPTAIEGEDGETLMLATVDGGEEVVFPPPPQAKAKRTKAPTTVSTHTRFTEFTSSH
jgi:hypothetical protein